MPKTKTVEVKDTQVRASLWAHGKIAAHQTKMRQSRTGRGTSLTTALDDLLEELQRLRSANKA